MIDPATDLAQDPPVRRLSGATGVGLAFVAGTLFALLPMYYFYAGSSGSAQREPAVAATDAAAPEAEKAASRGSSDRFASRLTYESSQTPEEPPVRAAPVNPAAALAAPEPVAATRREAPPAVDERSAGRVANARPINATPPELRDTTREIENEARRAEYSRAPSRPSRPEAAQGRVVEGRDVVVGVKASVATRPIGTSTTTTRQGDEADSAARVATATVLGNGERGTTDARTPQVVPGVSRIGPAPQVPPDRVDAARKSSAEDPANGSSSDVETRLAATREWLSAAPQTMHTIQIMGTNSEEQLKSHLRALSKILEPQKLYVFRTYAQGKPTMTVVYGGFADRQSALQALEKLPPSVSANKPVLRTVNGIRTELKQHGIRIES